jgi:hypothetical protein
MIGRVCDVTHRWSSVSLDRMQPDQARLAIDYGTVSTVAVVAWPDGRWLPLMFDGAVSLPSAVHVVSDGEPLTGQAAWRQAAIEPDRFVIAPLRAGSGTVTVGGADVAVMDLVAATLRRVGAEAVRVVGSPVADVRVVVPAAWGPRRRTWMRQVAYAAGLGQPRLVEAPVAAADHLVARGVQVPVGAVLLMCDVGGGFEATSLRRGPTGFEVLSTLADADAGSSRIDELLTSSSLVAASGAPADNAAPDGAAADGARPGDGNRWVTMASVRAAKESLSTLPVVTITMPSPAPALVINSVTVDAVARPVLLQAADVAARTVAAAEVSPEQLAGVWCVGAGAAMPAVPRLIGERLGVAPMSGPDPALAAVLGAAEVAGDTAPAGVVPGPAPAVPPMRRAVALVVPGLASLALVTYFLVTAHFENGTRIYRTSHSMCRRTGAYLPWRRCSPWWAAWPVVHCWARCWPAGADPPRRPHRADPAGRAGGYGDPRRGRDRDRHRWAFRGVRQPVFRGAGECAAAVGAVPGAARRGDRRRHRGHRDPAAAPPAGLGCLPGLPGDVGGVRGGRGSPGASLDDHAGSPGDGVVARADGRVGGLLIGVAVATALVDTLVLRLVAAAPLGVFFAAITSWRATGIMAVMVAVALWWARRLWILARSPVLPVAVVPAARSAQ